MTTEAKVYDCWQCGTAIDRPCDPARGGFTCACGNSYHNPDVKSQTATEFFRRLAELRERDRSVSHDIAVGAALVRVTRLDGLPLVHLSIRSVDRSQATVGLSFEQVDELCEALAAFAPVLYVPQVPPVSVLVAPSR